ncbi:tyrosine-type recombinase/integrase [Nonomuraea rubra]|uniref:tyrosine-type recombinase/integrase n=1 Tax=Nonomuraea rubra TaxID=46180 RepID=UPI00340F0AAD
MRTVLLDDRGYVTLLKLYLTRAGYAAGPLFRASINGRGGPLSYDAAHHRWQSYCAAARVEIDIHQLRHAHATELINAGVSVEAVRRRLGHTSAETTQIYALLDDKVADAEVRITRRRPRLSFLNTRFSRSPAADRAQQQQARLESLRRLPASCEGTPDNRETVTDDPSAPRREPVTDDAPLSRHRGAGHGRRPVTVTVT